MTSFAESTLRHDLYSNIYTLVSGVIGASCTVSAAYTDNAEDLPQVVINPITTNNDSYMFDRSRPSKTIPIIIDIYTKRAEHLDIFADALDTSLTSKFTTGTSKLVGLNLVRFTEDTAHSTIKGNKIHSKTLAWIFERKQ
jgi:hypothetical protein